MCSTHCVQIDMCTHCEQSACIVCATCGVVVLANTSEATVAVQLNGVATQAIYAS